MRAVPESTPRIQSDLLETADKDAFPPSGIVCLSSIILSSQVTPSAQPSPSPWSADETSDFLDTDLEMLTLSASLLEGLSIDLELAKQEIAFVAYAPAAPAPGSTLLSHLFNFIDSAAPPANWAKFGETEEEGFGAKAFATVKSAVVRAVVEAPNSDAVMDKLFMHGEGKNWVLEKLVEWVGETREGREDLLICAAHMLAALGRKGAYPVRDASSAGTNF